MIGFLPADKDLYEQSLASSSSSSIDLDEDTSKQQVEPDSLTFQCQYVMPAASDDNDDVRFNLVSCKREVADTGGEPKVSFYPKYRQQPKQPSTQAHELPSMTHTSCPPGCGRPGSFPVRAAENFTTDFHYTASICLYRTASGPSVINNLNLG